MSTKRMSLRTRVNLDVMCGLRSLCHNCDNESLYKMLHDVVCVFLRIADTTYNPERNVSIDADNVFRGAFEGYDEPDVRAGQRLKSQGKNLNFCVRTRLNKDEAERFECIVIRCGFRSKYEAFKYIIHCYCRLYWRQLRNAQSQIAQKVADENVCEMQAMFNEYSEAELPDYVKPVRSKHRLIQERV